MVRTKVQYISGLKVQIEREPKNAFINKIKIHCTVALRVR